MRYGARSRAAAADPAARTALSKVHENIVNPSSRKPGAWSARAMWSAAVFPWRSAAAAMSRAASCSRGAGEVGLAAEVGGEVGRAHQQRVDVGQRRDRVDGLERARPLDLHDAGDARSARGRKSGPAAP